jgi:hypothetical protein
MNNKKLKWAFLAVWLAASATQTHAADKEFRMPFAALLESAEARQKLDDTFGFYLQGQQTPKVLERMGQDVSNKKSNAFAKETTSTCQWAALSALISLQEKAKRMGANAVIDIVSYYKKDPFAARRNTNAMWAWS